MIILITVLGVFWYINIILNKIYLNSRSWKYIINIPNNKMKVCKMPNVEIEATKHIIKGDRQMFIFLLLKELNFNFKC